MPVVMLLWLFVMCNDRVRWAVHHSRPVSLRCEALHLLCQVGVSVRTGILMPIKCHLCVTANASGLLLFDPVLFRVYCPVMFD